ncbi:gastrin/cholecystokinin type B receptor-like [Mizuhopecten yessoensis]|uniref:Pyroglutamylated RFamide peptide receptor n=1 Tax=Mizuhopecten yessoensis TaxID=6573 RepID=A0A210R4L8_MIZYE|nr:gastrin/cholecystokinin type B receptor-like [Mizuhopecten yessoensis]OWF55977.1 Pyroglutamylated RFamide peptide receptor [Mizuhopecten yessoensis]
MYSSTTLVSPTPSTPFGISGNVTSQTGFNASPNHNSTISSPGLNLSSPGLNSSSSIFDDVESLCCNPTTSSLFPNFCEKLMLVVFSDWDMYLASFELDESPKIVLAVLYGVIVFTSLVGNSLVLLTFAFNRHMRSTTNVFIMSLAVSDLLYTLTAAPFDITVTFTTFWQSGSFSCKMVPFMNSLSVSCSSMTLCCIAFDRFYAIVYPFKGKIFQSPMKAFALLLFVWVLSVATSLPNAQQYELVPYRSRCDTKYLCMQPLVNGVAGEVLQTWLSFTLLFLLPLLVMSVLYGIIIHRLWIKRPIGSSVQPSESNQLRIKKKAIKMLLVVVFLYVICWLPLQCFSIIIQKSDVRPTQSIRQLRKFLQCLAVSSCCYNPVIYTLMNEKFRRNFLNVIMCRTKVFPQITNSKVENLRRQHNKRRILPRHPNTLLAEPPSRDTLETRL